MHEAAALYSLGMSLTDNLSSNDDLVDGLWTGTCTAYARSFVRGTKMDCLREPFRKFPTTERRNRHFGLIEMRHTRGAHKDRAAEEKKTEKLGLKGECSKILLRVSDDGETEWQVKRDHYPNVTLARIKDLCEFQEQRLAKASNKQIMHLVGTGEINTGTYDLQRGLVVPPRKGELE